MRKYYSLLLVVLFALTFGFLGKAAFADESELDSDRAEVEFYEDDNDGVDNDQAVDGEEELETDEDEDEDDAIEDVDETDVAD